MYRNSEYYPDPTAGVALAHIAYEERLARKKNRQANGRKASAKAHARSHILVPKHRRKQGVIEYDKCFAGAGHPR